jgi:hypothetical protein
MHHNEKFESKSMRYNFHNRTLHLEIIYVLSSIDAQENFFKRNIKIYITTAPSCFGANTITREALFELAKVTVVKIVN